jgi:hypothetical protein
MATVATYNPLDLHAGSQPVRSVPMTLKANSGAVGAFAPLCFETTNYTVEKVDAIADRATFVGLLAPIDPSNAAGVTADANGFYGLADSASARTVQVLVAGDFWDDIIPWPGAFTTIGQKQYLVSTTDITVQAPKAGQI